MVSIRRLDGISSNDDIDLLISGLFLSQFHGFKHQLELIDRPNLKLFESNVDILNLLGLQSEDQGLDLGVAGGSSEFDFPVSDIFNEEGSDQGLQVAKLRLIIRTNIN